MPAHKKAPNSVRTEGVSVRLDPKLYYLASMAARDQVRTLSSFIEWAVRRTLADAVAMRNEPSPGQWPAELPALWEERLWDADEAERFYRLARMRPGLLTIHEQQLWKAMSMKLTEKKSRFTLQEFRTLWAEIHAEPQTKGGK